VSPAKAVVEGLGEGLLGHSATATPVAFIDERTRAELEHSVAGHAWASLPLPAPIGVGASPGSKNSCIDPGSPATSTQTPATPATYAYDGLGRRIQKTVGADTFDDYHNESWQVVEVRKNQASDADPIEQFVYDTNYIDALVMRWYDANQDNAADEQFYLYDASFNVTALLDEDGLAIERYRYTPYGERIVLDADFTADADNTTDYANHRGFQGLNHDDESGLIENRARMLDPLTGRFIQRDPLGYPDGMNTYAAYHVMWGGVDPMGLYSDEDCYKDCDKVAEAYRKKHKNSPAIDNWHYNCIKCCGKNPDPKCASSLDITTPLPDTPRPRKECPQPDYN